MMDENLSDILAMSGYAGYVWSAFGVTLLALLVLYFTARKRLKKALRIQQQLLAERKTQ